MNANEYYQKWLNETDEQALKASFLQSLKDENIKSTDFCALVTSFAATPSKLENAQERRCLALTLLALGLKKASGFENDYFSLVMTPQFSAHVKDSDWLMTSMSRLLGASITAEQLPKFFEIISKSNYSLAVREQAMLCITACWQLNDKLSKEIIPGLRTMLENGVAPTENWHLPMAILINALALGGESLKRHAQEYFKNCTAQFADFPLGANLDAFFALPPATLRGMLKQGVSKNYEAPETEFDNLLNPKPVENPDEMLQPRAPTHREAPKIGRNDPCPCGSGKKYKKCCGR